MSLAALNYPPLVAAAGAGLYAVLPLAQRALAEGTVSWTTIQAAQVVAFGLNVFATSRPGRFDSQEATATTIRSAKDATATTTATSKSGAEGSEEMYARLSKDRNAKTLVAPAGWAFSIWGLIYLGEFLMVASCLRVPASDAVVAPLKARSGPFILAQLFHVLWAASFRPKYQGKLMFISFAMLSGIALSLSQAHALSTIANAWSWPEYLLYVLPLSLHFGWTSAASLVNLNGAFALQDCVSAQTMAWLGHGSVVVATALGISITLLRSAPVYGSVIAWALAACADGMTQRLQRAAKKEQDPTRDVGLYGVRRQRTLAWIGAAICAATALVTAVRS